MRQSLAASLLLTLLAAFLWTAFPASTAWAQAQQSTAETSVPFSVTLAQWQRQLDTIDSYVAQPATHAPQRTQEYRQDAAEVRNQALEIRTEAQSRIESLERLLAALGERPEEGDEPANVTQTRRSYADDLAVQRSRASLAELVATRADTLDRELAQLQRESTVAELTERGPFPLAPSTVRVAIPEFVAVLGQIATIPFDWWSSLDAEQQEAEPFLRLALFLAAAVLIGWGVRQIILRQFGRDPATEDPAYARRLLGAVAEGVARGIVPGSILALFFVLVITGRTPFDGEMARLLSVTTGVGMVFVIAIALTGAVFAPDLPSWRLIAVSRENARIIGRRLWALIGLFAIDVLLTSNADAAEISPELRAFYALIAGGLLGTTMLLLARASLWQSVKGAIPDDPDLEDDEVYATRAPIAVGFWNWVRRISVLVVVGGILALLAGYYNLGSYLIDSLLVSFLIVGALGLVRGLLRESVGVLSRSQLTRERLGLTPAARHRIKFWLRAALDPLLAFLAALMVAPIWGVPIADMWQWTVRVLSGFQIGNVTISISDIGLALGVFAGLIFVIRLIQRGLAERILPETSLDPGLQHSLSAGFGYAGLILAFLIGITVLGIDLSTLALIAGALSVGIGFGLRDVVNNFVCGLILLIERPIKVGDWVVIGQHEGFVKQINLRATEIETWQRAAVFVPNAEIIGHPLTNWTHKDKYGRVDVQVRVAYGSDLEKVESILLEAARQHPKVLLQPEPYVLLRDFADFGFLFELRAYTGDVIWTIVTASEMRHQIDARFREEGIVIPFPQRTLHQGDQGEGANALVDEEGRRIEPSNPPRPRVVAATVRSDPKPSAVARGGQGDVEG